MVLGLGHFEIFAVDTPEFSRKVAKKLKKLEKLYPGISDNHVLQKYISDVFTSEVKKHNIDKLTGHEFGLILRGYLIQEGMSYLVRNETPEKEPPLLTNDITDQLDKFCLKADFKNNEYQLLQQHLATLKIKPKEVASYIQGYLLEMGLTQLEDKFNTILANNSDNTGGNNWYRQEEDKGKLGANAFNAMDQINKEILLAVKNFSKGEASAFNHSPQYHQNWLKNQLTQDAAEEFIEYSSSPLGATERVE